MLTIAARLFGCASRARSSWPGWLAGLALLVGIGLTPPAGATETSLEDVTLVDQHGNRLHLYSDLLAGKVVVLNAFFTSCEAVCPVVSGRLRQLQDRLGERLGKDITMVSVTLDPSVDSPARLKAYADKLKARPGWRFVTGDAEAMTRVLNQLGFDTQQKEDHSGMLMVVNEPRGLWRKISGLESVAEIEAMVNRVAAPE